MSSPLQNNITNLQNVLNTINSLPNAGSNDVELPTLTNPGDASKALLGYEFINSNGVKITGTIPTKTSSDLSASGATVTVPAGYYASNVTKSVTTTTRANTTISTTADDTNDKLTITAYNNQSTGYVTGASKTATTTISLTASGATVTASDGSKSISKSVATATQATPSVSIDSAGKITATATQTAGYVSAGTKTGTKQLTTQAAKTVTPSTSSQTAVAKNVYTTGAVTVAAIPSKYVDNSTVTAVESDVMSGKKYGAPGSVKTGTFSLDTELTQQESLINQIATALQGKASGGGSGSGGGGVETCMISVEDEVSFGLVTFMYIWYGDGEFHLEECSPYETEVICNQWVIVCADGLRLNQFDDVLYNIEVASVDGSSYYDPGSSQLFIGTSDTTVTVLEID